MDHTPITDEMLEESRRQLDTRFEQLALSVRRVLAERDEARMTVAALRKSLGQASDELYGDPEARIGGWKERAVAAEAARDALQAIIDSRALSEVEQTVAGWRGPPEKPYQPHRPGVGATIKTTCGRMYKLADALAAARAALALAQPE